MRKARQRAPSACTCTFLHRPFWNAKHVCFLSVFLDAYAPQRMPAHGADGGGEETKAALVTACVRGAEAQLPVRGGAARLLLHQLCIFRGVERVLLLLSLRQRLRRNRRVAW